MNLKERMIRQWAPALVVAALAGVGGCSAISNLTGSGQSNQAASGQNGSGAAQSPTGSEGCILRVTLSTLLQEHVTLLADTTGADLGGRTDEFKAAEAALDENSVHLANAISNAFGSETGDSFLALWRKQNDALIEYANGLTAKDQDAQDKADSEMEQFAEDFGKFMDEATSSRLSKDAMSDMMKDDVLGLRRMIDAQASGDFGTAYSKIMVSEQDAQTLASTLTDEFIAQFPAKFGS